MQLQSDAVRWWLGLQWLDDTQDWLPVKKLMAETGRPQFSSMWPFHEASAFEHMATGSRYIS